VRFHRSYLILSSLAVVALCVAELLTLGGYFKSVEKSSSGGASEKRLVTQLKVFHEQLRRAEGPEEAKAALKVVEHLTGLGPESELAQELKKAYAPVLAAFAAKPREAETRFQLAKKREIMETLVNAYRKEVLHGDIRVRAAYLNVLFDTQGSLLSETDEAEQVFLKRNRERMDGLKSLAATAPDRTLPGRVAAIDGLLQSYDRGFQQATKWRAEKAEALAKVEKALPGIARAIASGQDAGVDDTRGTFLYICFLALLISVASFLLLYVGYKVLRVRGEMKLDAFLTYLRAFGGDRADSQQQAALRVLREDSDWAPLLTEAERAEEAFVRSCQNHLAVSRSIHTPYFVVGKDRTVRYWNDGAARLFGFSPGKEWGFGDLMRTERLSVKEGSADAALDLVRSSFASVAEDRFELLVKDDNTWQPYELPTRPPPPGPLAGGKVYVWREVRGEADRIDRSVAAQLERIRDLAHKVSHQFPVDLSGQDSDPPATRSMIADLATLKARTDERELLWKSEVQALIDQVSRQQDVLHKLGEELSRVRKEQAEALELVKLVHGGEEHLHDEVCVMERDLERWTSNRRRLLRDLELQAATLERARQFEKRLREANEEVAREVDGFDSGLDELRRFVEQARVHSVNLSLVKDPAHWEYASRARSFANDLTQFLERAGELSRKIRFFVRSHPGGALAAHLGGAALDEQLLESIGEEQERLATLVKRWKITGEELLSGGERAVSILQEAEQKAAVLTQLGETSLLISQQAKGNLERWN